MYYAMIVVFVLGYLAIALEHPLRIDKAATALVTGVVSWALYAFLVQSAPESAHGDGHGVEGHLLHHLSEIASILFFLMGAMTIVEVVDGHQGFSVITDRIKTTNKVKLLWIVAILTFFFSAVLDNLTTSIVMVSLLRKLIKDKETRWFFSGIIVVAANAGGAWSPIGDVTTTMLWIGGQITAGAIIKNIFIASLFTLIVPMIVISLRMKGEVTRPDKVEAGGHHSVEVADREKKLIFFAGVLGLLFVPVFKTVTHLPPFMGMMLSLGVLWIITEKLHAHKLDHEKHGLNVLAALRKIDTASVLFFLGILLAVSSLQSAGQLGMVAASLDNVFDTSQNSGVYGINLVIGLLSSIVDNVPLVAAAMGMYDTAATGLFMQDGLFWEFLAYCAGTGGSALIIGSAAGVAVMGIEKIDFIWYLKRISLLAVLGYLAGAGWYIFENSVLGGF